MSEATLAAIRELIAQCSTEEQATVAMSPNAFWTDDFRTAAQWLRESENGKRMTVTARTPRKRLPSIPTRTGGG